MNNNENELFTQQTELHPVKIIILHKPEMENFMSTLHPAASLYVDVVKYSEVIENFNNLREITSRLNIQVLTVKECLLKNRPSLEKHAHNHLNYEVEDNDEYKALSP